jgi:hypothetical protein
VVGRPDPHKSTGISRGNVPRRGGGIVFLFFFIFFLYKIFNKNEKKKILIFIKLPSRGAELCDGGVADVAGVGGRNKRIVEVADDHVVGNAVHKPDFLGY